MTVVGRRARCAQPSTRLAAKRRRGKRPKGFTLIEVMIAGTFFLLAFAGAVMGMGAASRSYEHHRHTTAALALTETVFEQLLLLPKDNANLAAGMHTRKFDADGTVNDATGVYTANWIIDADTPLNDLRTIRLELTWNETNGTVRRLVMRTVRP